MTQRLFEAVLAGCLPAGPPSSACAAAFSPRRCTSATAPRRAGTASAAPAHRRDR